LFIANKILDQGLLHIYPFYGQSQELSGTMTFKENKCF
jgi:hypothetical protein